MGKKKTSRLRLAFKNTKSVMYYNPKIKIGIYLLAVGFKHYRLAYVWHGLRILLAGISELMAGVRYGK